MCSYISTSSYTQKGVLNLTQRLLGFLLHRKKPAWDSADEVPMCISSYLARPSTTNRKAITTFDGLFVLYFSRYLDIDHRNHLCLLCPWFCRKCISASSGPEKVLSLLQTWTCRKLWYSWAIELKFLVGPTDNIIDFLWQTLKPLKT